MRLPKYSKCPYCSRYLEMHHYSQHTRKCFMKHENMKHIMTYFMNSIEDPQLLRRKKFHQYCVEDVQILSPVSMGNYFNQNHFKLLVIQLLILLYRKNLFDWEYAELIIYHITNGKFCMNDEYFCQLKRNTRDSRGLKAIDTNTNYQSLIMAVITRAELDLNFVVGKKDENNETINENCIIDALDFLFEVKPDSIESARTSGKMSKDTERLLIQHS